MTKRFKNTMAAATLYDLGISFHNFGTLRGKSGVDGRAKDYFDFYEVDYIRPEQKRALLEIAPDVQFKTNGKLYAPELRSILICFPKAAWYRI